MFVIANDEIKECPKLGDFILCKLCGERHKIEFGFEVMPDGTKVPTKMLAYYKCGEKAYLAGIDGKDIRGK